MKKHSWIGILCAVVLASVVLTACEPTTPPKTDPPKVEKQIASPKKVEPPKTDEVKLARNVAAANLISLSAKAGLVKRCHDTGEFKDDTVEDTYYRLRAIFVQARDADPDGEGKDLADISYAAYALAYQQGIVRLVEVPKENNPDAHFITTDIPGTPALCPRFSEEILEARKPGGVLNVKPNYGTKGAKDRT